MRSFNGTITFSLFALSGVLKMIISTVSNIFLTRSEHALCLFHFLFIHSKLFCWWLEQVWRWWIKLASDKITFSSSELIKLVQMMILTNYYQLLFNWAYYKSIMAPFLFQNIEKIFAGYLRVCLFIDLSIQRTEADNLLLKGFACYILEC